MARLTGPCARDGKARHYAKMRVAWFSPLAPIRSGIASYSAMVLPSLARRHEIALFAGDDAWPTHRAIARTGADGFLAADSPWGAIRAAHDFAPIHRARPFIVGLQLGNAGCHDHMWAYLTRYPGLVVLHDAQLHQSRAHAPPRPRAARRPARRAALRPSRRPSGRRRVDHRRPRQPRRADLADDCGSAWAARAVAVHFPALAADLREAWPGLEVCEIRHGSPNLQSCSEHAPSMLRARSKHVPVTFAAFGLALTPEKRVPQMLRALATIRAHVPGVRLQLVGDVTPHYDVQADARSHVSRTWSR